MSGALWTRDEADQNGGTGRLELDLADPVYRKLPADSSLKAAVKRALDRRCPHCHKGHLEDWCENPIPAQFTNGEGEATDRVCIRCNLYRCTYCGTRLARLHRQLISEGAEQWIEDETVYVYGFTQTVDPDSDLEWDFDDGDAHKQITRVWQKHRRILEQEGTAVLAYVVVPEAHKSGRVHWHGIVVTERPLKKCTPAARGGYNRWARARGQPVARRGECVCTRRANSPAPCFQATARQSGLGINDLQALRSAKKMSRYITKKISAYVLKGVGAETHWPRYARRVRYSRNFSPLTMGQLRALIRQRVEESLRERGEWTDRTDQTLEVLIHDLPTFGWVIRRRRDRLSDEPDSAIPVG